MSFSGFHSGTNRFASKLRYSALTIFFAATLGVFGPVLIGSESVGLWEKGVETFEPSLQQWVASDSGVIHGFVVRPSGVMAPVAAMKIRLLAINDDAVFRTTADPSGKFELNGVAPGAYIIVATGNGYYASYVLHVVEKDAESLGAVCDVPLAYADASVMRDIARKYVPVHLSGAAAPLPLFSEGLIPSGADMPGRPIVTKTSEGGVQGRLMLPAVGDEPRLAAKAMNVLIMSAGKTIQKTVSDAEGRFSVPSIPSGEYTLVAAGEPGFIAFGFELVDSTRSAITENGGARTVGTFGGRHERGVRRDPCSEICCEVIPVCEVVSVTEITFAEPSADSREKVLLAGCFGGRD